MSTLPYRVTTARGKKTAPTGMTIEFEDNGPDREDRRHFTLTWPVAPHTEGFPLTGPTKLVTRRAQCFFSAQWRGFIAKGAIVTRGAV